MQVDYYKVLGIPREANSDQIKQAYRTKAKLYHPDINSSPNAKMLFQLINEAYQILVNPEKRRWYDFKLKFPSSTGLNPKSRGYRTAAYQSYYRKHTQSQQEEQKEKEINKQTKTLLDNFLFYFLVVAGGMAIIFSIIDLLSDKEENKSISGLVFGVWFLFLLFYGWRKMWEKKK